MERNVLNNDWQLSVSILNKYSCEVNLRTDKSIQVWKGGYTSGGSI